MRPLVLRDFEDCLRQAMPQVGNHDWKWTVLRARARAGRQLPWKLYRVLRRLGSQRKPYFIGQSHRGTRYMGDFRDWYATMCAVFPDYDATIIKFMESRLAQTGGVFADVGTNLGIVAATLAQGAQSRSTVIAFEPMPETARRAACTFALNQLANVQLYQAAVGDEDGEIPFYVPLEHSEGASAHPADLADVNYQQVRVPCTRLDRLVERGSLERVGLLKLDVEGHEYNAVQGARELIARDRPAMLCEYNYGVAPGAGWTAADLAGLIRQCGGEYRFQVLYDDDHLTDFPPPSDVKEIVNIYAESVAVPAFAVR